MPRSFSTSLAVIAVLAAVVLGGIGIGCGSVPSQTCDRLPAVSAPASRILEAAPHEARSTATIPEPSLSLPVSDRIVSLASSTPGEPTLSPPRLYLRDRRLLL